MGFGEGVGGRPGVAAGHVERLKVELVGLVASVPTTAGSTPPAFAAGPANRAPTATFAARLHVVETRRQRGARRRRGRAARGRAIG